MNNLDQTIILYFVINHNGEYFMGNIPTSLMSETQVNMRFTKDIKEARIYNAIGGPRGVVTRFKKAQPNYPTLCIGEYEASFINIIDEEERVKNSINSSKIKYKNRVLKMYQTQILALSGETKRHQVKAEELSEKITQIKEEIIQLENESITSA